MGLRGRVGLEGRLETKAGSDLRERMAFLRRIVLFLKSMTARRICERQFFLGYSPMPKSFILTVGLGWLRLDTGLVLSDSFASFYFPRFAFRILLLASYFLLFSFLFSFLSIFFFSRLLDTHGVGISSPCTYLPIFVDDSKGGTSAQDTITFIPR